MTYRLQFFSGINAEGEGVLDHHGYDGSMTVEAFDPKDLPAYAERMDCIFGPCVCVVTAKEAWGEHTRAYPFERTQG